MKRVGFIPFKKVLAQCEMKTASSRIWTLITTFISHDDIHYTMSGFIYIYMCVCVCVWVYLCVCVYCLLIIISYLVGNRNSLLPLEIKVINLMSNLFISWEVFFEIFIRNLKSITFVFIIYYVRHWNINFQGLFSLITKHLVFFLTAINLKMSSYNINALFSENISLLKCTSLIKY